MADKYVVLNPKGVIAGQDLGGNLRSIAVEYRTAELDGTNMKSGGHMERVAGLQDAQVDLEFYQSFAASEVYDTLQGMQGEKVNLKIDPTTPGMTDEIDLDVIVGRLPTFTGAVGELSTWTVTWNAALRPTVDPGALFTATMLVGHHSTQDYSGFDRNSGARWGRLTPSDFAEDGGDLNDDDMDSRIVTLFLDESERRLYVRVNRRQDFRGRWIRVGDDWLEMHTRNAQGRGFTTGDGSETASFDITADAGWDDTHYVWTELNILPVGVYPRVPTSGDVLPTTPNLLSTSTMTVANVGNEFGFKDDPGGYGALANRDITPFARDGEITIDEVSYDTGANELTFVMDSTADATRVNGMWLAVRPDADSPYDLAVQVQAGSNNTLTIVGSQPPDPSWTVGATRLVELWDRDPR